jgi:hemerythrin-like metal-binding protein
MSYLSYVEAGDKCLSTGDNEMGHYVAWKPYYSVGHAAIDKEHQRLLDIIDDLFTAVKDEHKQARTEGALKRLVEYTLTHFDHEESVMQKCGYPDLEAHKKLHDEMRSRVRDLCDKPDSVAVQDVLSFLKEWWTRHIQSRDKAYSPFLNAETPRPERGK